jgi:hypothetical protein
VVGMIELVRCMALISRSRPAPRCARAGDRGTRSSTVRCTAGFPTEDAEVSVWKKAGEDTYRAQHRRRQRSLHGTICCVENVTALGGRPRREGWMSTWSSRRCRSAGRGCMRSCAPRRWEPPFPSIVSASTMRTGRCGRVGA